MDHDTTPPLANANRHGPQWQKRHVDRLLLVGLDGATFDVLVPLAEAGVMPNLAALLQTSALVRTHTGDAPCEGPAWSTLRTGCGPETHEVLDDYYLDHRRRMILPTAPRPVPCPTLIERVMTADPRGLAISLFDARPASAVWNRKPTDLAALDAGLMRIEADLRYCTGRAYQADASNDWRLLELRLDVLDALQHRLWNAIGVTGAATRGNAWVRRVQQTLRSLDNHLGELTELADRRNAAMVLASPYGFGPFREKINLFELLRQERLLRRARPVRRATYQLSRLAGRGLRWLGRRLQLPPLPPRRWYPTRRLLPINWRHSQALTLHGELSALVYLNTPERFASKAILTSRQQEQATQDVLAALAGAQHPLTGEVLFQEVYATAERFSGNPLARLWPDVIARPAPGFQVRHCPDRSGQLLRGDPSLAATHYQEGLLMIRAPGVALGRAYRGNLVDVAPTLLDLLDVAPAPSMSGRVLDEIFFGSTVVTLPIENAG
jgi:predicted AlkP superfamily phosphohydrolase/phosphomutase